MSGSLISSKFNILKIFNRPWVDKKQNDRVQIFSNAIDSANEWTEQMLVADQMVQRFVDDEVRATNTIEK